MNLEHRVEVRKAYDCTDGCEYGSERCAPGSDGFHGIDCARIEFAVIGPEGAIVFSLFSAWFKRETVTRLKDNPAVGWMLANGLGDVRFHARRPVHPQSDFLNEHCAWTGSACYYDGSSLQAQSAYDVLVEKGSDALWGYLTAQYALRFAPAAENPRRITSIALRLLRRLRAS